MALDTTTPAVGDGTRRADYVRLLTNDQYLDGKNGIIRARTTLGTPLAAGETKYLCEAGHHGTESEAWTIVGKALKLKNLRVQLSGDPGNTFTYTVTLRYGAGAGAIADSALTCVVTGNGSSVLTASDTTNVVTVAAGGVFTIKAVVSAGASSRSMTVAIETDSAV